MTELRVAVVHYHLRGGGATRVIDHAAAGFEALGGRVVVLVGEAPSAPLQECAAEVRVVDNLGYADGSREVDPADFATRMRDAAREALGGTPDLWHIHNYSLGKNATLPRFVRTLAEDGERCLLQIHDFAEDGRPDNYRFLADQLADGDEAALAQALYPTGGHVHYAVLNSRDRSFLARAGVPETNLHLLPNAVCLPELPDQADPDLAPGRRVILYPTRGIRRKNMGEFLLWATLAACRGHQQETLFASTLLPKNPAQQAIHRRWEDFASAHALPVAFGVGTQWDASFGGVLKRADAIITTSVGEGFGLAFLEPLGIPKPLCGRALPEITNEFVEAGVDLSSLYERLEVPLSWVGGRELRDRLRAGVEASLAAYGRELCAADLETAWSAAVREGRVDMGRLDEELQIRVLEQLLKDPAAADEVGPGRLNDQPLPEERSAANRQVVRTVYDRCRMSERLLALYQGVADSQATELTAARGDRLLEQFIDPARFMLLRS